MKKIKTISLLTLLAVALISCGQNSNSRSQLGKISAEKELKLALTDKTLHNVVDHKKIIIKDETTAVTIAESILFCIYGKEKITKQRPYEIYNIDNYWIIYGTLPKGYVGGTFLIIIDSRDSKIIKITHGK